jgi:hypothetical protein
LDDNKIKGLMALPKLTENIFIFVLIFIIFIPLANGKDFMIRRKAADYTVDVAINRNPPIVGRNEIRIDIKDISGKYVTSASVTVNYYMPPMPGMPPMNYTVKAPLNGSGYNAIMDIIMTGPWMVAIRAVVPGKQLSVSIPIDVR